MSSITWNEDHDEYRGFDEKDAICFVCGRVWGEHADANTARSMGTWSGSGTTVFLCHTCAHGDLRAIAALVVDAATAVEGASQPMPSAPSPVEDRIRRAITTVQRKFHTAVWKAGFEVLWRTYRSHIQFAYTHWRGGE